MNEVPGTKCSRNVCTYRKHMDNQHGIYLFSAQLMGGGEILRSSGSEAGQSVDFVRRLYIIWLWASLSIYFRMSFIHNMAPIGK